jgi:hypothetical protein
MQELQIDLQRNTVYSKRGSPALEIAFKLHEGCVSPQDLWLVKVDNLSSSSDLNYNNFKPRPDCSASVLFLRYWEAHISQCYIKT